MPREVALTEALQRRFACAYQRSRVPAYIARYIRGDVDFHSGSRLLRLLKCTAVEDVGIVSGMKAAFADRDDRRSAGAEEGCVLRAAETAAGRGSHYNGRVVAGY